MARVGWLLLIFGAGSLLLPVFDLQFRILQPIEDFQPYAGIALAVIGAVIIALPMLRARSGGSGPTA